MQNLLLRLFSGKIFPIKDYSSNLKEYRQQRSKTYEQQSVFIEQLKKLDPKLSDEYSKMDSAALYVGIGSR